jgi:hypothetical protein
MRGRRGSLGNRASQLSYLAAVFAFFVTYIVASVAYVELALISFHFYFRERQALLGLLLFLICLASAIIAFRMV